MTLQLLLDQRNMSKYHLSKISGVSKTTIMDICADRQLGGSYTIPRRKKNSGCFKKSRILNMVSSETRGQNE